MRQIKFRAWDEDRKQMIYDFSTISVKLLQANMEDGGFIFCGGYQENEDWHEPILMQFTGLKDSTGKEIYEGDIIESTFSDGKPCRHVIEYSSEQAQFVAVFIQNNYSPVKSEGGIKQSWVNEFKKKVVGNIYQNQNLLTL